VPGGQQQGRGGSRYAPSRGTSGPAPQPTLDDDQIDEERILRARGDAEGRRLLDERG
jgi:hypothetical protein